jgi:hypothetical protein
MRSKSFQHGPSPLKKPDDQSKSPRASVLRLVGCNPTLIENFQYFHWPSRQMELLRPFRPELLVGGDLED